MPSEAGGEYDPIREKIIGLGENSFRKSYYPELQRKLADLEQFRALLDESNDAIFLINLQDRRFVDVSGSACKQLGYDRNEFLAMSLSDIVAADAREQIRELFSGQSERTYILTSLRCKYGHWLPYEITVHTVRLNDRSFVVAVGRDITDRKRIEDQLRRSEETYREIFEGANDGILLLDMGTGKTMDVNNAICHMYGFTREEAMHVDFLNLYAGTHYDRNGILRLFKEIKHSGPRLSVHKSRTRDGRLFWAEYDMKCVRILGEDMIMAIVRDVSERKTAEEKIKASLREKEVMLKEIHHRVKNNLQVVSSLLSLQSRNISDPADARLFQESQNRVQTMALVHEKLYQSSDLARIDFSSYIDSLMKNLFYSYALGRDNISMTADVGHISLSIDAAVPCGLIVNELISNSLKHAFPGGRGGEIRVSIHEIDGRIVLDVSDTGIGLPESFDIHTSESLGILLVTMLVEQLDGSISLERSGGTKFTITFKRT